ncbi:hypothetical protein ACVPOY_08920 [Staphylococcus aureus]
MKPWKIQLMKVKKKKRFKLKMPGAFMILFILTVVAVIATWVIPAGAYSQSFLRTFIPRTKSS